MSDAETTGTEEHAAVIAGEHVRPGEWIDVVDPFDGSPLARVARCRAPEVEAAVRAARETYETHWRHTTAQQRAELCRALAATLRAEGEALARTESLDTGKPLGQARTDAEVAARYFDFYGGVVEALGGETVLTRPDLLAFTLREPYGVCGHIIPWNYPLQVAARTVAPALAAGNCCVLKPAEDAPLTPCGSANWPWPPDSRPAPSTSCPATARRPERRWPPTPASTTWPSPAPAKWVSRSWRRPHATSSPSPWNSAANHRTSCSRTPTSSAPCR
ncbi:hypothetical protein GCM10020000_24410 [Streptomyces olivoverticillatus]